jgi:hypothetical protein
MSNDDFLLNLINDIVAAGAPAIPEADYGKYFVASMVFCVLLIGTVVLIGRVICFSGHISGGSWVVLCLLLIGFGVGMLCNQYRFTSGREAYEKELAVYEESKAVYDQAVIDCKAENERMLEVRKAYKIYLDGKETSYDKVSFANYDFQISDEEQTIWLAAKRKG